MLLCVCRLSGYLIAIPIPKPPHEDKDEGPTGKRAAHLVMEGAGWIGSEPLVKYVSTVGHNL